MNRLYYLLSLVALLGLTQCHPVETEKPGLSEAPKKTVLRHLFLFVGDGMGAPQLELAQACRTISPEDEGTKSPKGLIFFDSAVFPVMHKTGTLNCDNKCTDSAAGGTAFACGEKTRNGYVGLDRNGKPLKSLAETAAEKGYFIALISSSGLNDATPAAFYGHVKNRRNYTALHEQARTSCVHYFGGGGFLGDAGEQKKTEAHFGRTDDPQIWHAPSFKARPVYFHAEPFTVWNQRQVPPKSCSLSEHFSTMMDYHDTHFPDSPIFMMLENGHIDYGGHHNDACKQMAEVLELDRAVRTAVKQCQTADATSLIVVTADHETGDLMVRRGCAETAADALMRQSDFKADLNRPLERLLKRTGSKDEVMAFLRESFGVDSGVIFSPEETNRIQTAVDTGDAALLLHTFSAVRDGHLGIKYGSFGHSTQMVRTFFSSNTPDTDAQETENTDTYQIILNWIEEK